MLFNIPTLLLVICTAYTPALDECGKTDGITASGHLATAGTTVACDGLPLGTEVVIDGKSYIVQDIFGGGHGKTKIDIFMNTKAEAFRFGRQTKIVEVKPYVDTKATFDSQDWSKGLYPAQELARRNTIF